MRNVLTLIFCAAICSVMTACAGGPVEPTINAVDDGSMTIFEAAADPAAADMLEAILKSGPDVNAKDENGLTPLHYAALADNGPAVRILLAANADRESLSPNGQTALELAEQQESMNALQAFDRSDKIR